MADRQAQRRRTRQAIVAAAKDLLLQGEPVSADSVAAAADVSRRTVYMHFPSLDQLTLDATLGALSEAEAEGHPDGETQPHVRARVAALARSMIDTAAETLPLGRQIIRLTVDPGSPPGASQGVRGYRRIQWIEQALEPARDRLDEQQFDRLVSALAMVLGFEGMVVLRDIRALDAEHDSGVILWAATTLVDAALPEAEAEAEAD